MFLVKKKKEKGEETLTVSQGEGKMGIGSESPRRGRCTLGPGLSVVFLPYASEQRKGHQRARDRGQQSGLEGCSQPAERRGRPSLHLSGTMEPGPSGGDKTEAPEASGCICPKDASVSLACLAPSHVDFSY